MLKGTLFVLLSVAIMTMFISFTSQKENIYTLNENQMIMMYNAIIQTKQILPTSQAPAIQVTNLTRDFDSIQKVLSIQYNNFHPDTTTKSKK